MKNYVKIQSIDYLVELGFTAKKCGRDVPFMEAWL